MSTPHETKIHAMHPTQITVGMIEVRDKYNEICALKPHQQRDYLAARPMPAVCGPEGRFYLIDHHHLARAAWQAGIEHAFVEVEADWAAQPLADFWQQMVHAHWAHPIDEHGERRPTQEIPEHVKGLRNDDYRSLAQYVRAADGFQKTPTPYEEFVWANWFRSRVVIPSTRAGFLHAVQDALQLAHSQAARDLPGYLPDRKME